jgi:RNA polymerase sigma factor (sigma-70 family)
MQQQSEKKHVQEVADMLYDRYAATIFSYLRQHTQTREDAEDILVDIFLAALENEKFAQLAEASQVAWLWRVARNKLIDLYRRSAVRRSVPLEQVAETMFEPENQNPEQVALRLDDIAQVKKILKHLTPLQQEVMQLRFGYNLRTSEIGEIIGKREEAVRTMLSRILNQLRHTYSIVGDRKE